MEIVKIIDYIIPHIEKYQNVDDLLENNRSHFMFDTKQTLSIDELLKENFVCIVGEPGIGKSRLLDEIKKKMVIEPFFCKASDITKKSIAYKNEYCIIDALDEVEGNKFYNVLQSIKQYKKENSEVKVLFTCRKHYVASYARHFADCNHLTFVEICRLDEIDVINVISDPRNCSGAALEIIKKNPKLKELIRIPRYLMFFLKYNEQNKEYSNIGELFEYMIACSIDGAITARADINKNESFKILVQRVLEKVAFVMEISRSDQISKDDLYTILDGIKGNMTQMFIANFDLLFFESRILKDTNGMLQFENTELQEYLAAKELCRQDNIESVLYDVAVHKDLKHIYPNWYDVIPHISYSEDRIQTFINIFKLIVSYESNLDNKSFENLLKYVDSSVLSLQHKEELFSIIFDHYQRIPAYIMWRGPIAELLGECYNSNCDSKILLPLDHLNNIKLFNIYVILDAIAEKDKQSKCIADYWHKAANDLMATGIIEKQLAALDFYNALKCRDELIQLSKSYNQFTNELKDKYCEVTGYSKIVENDVVNCWLNDCYVSNPYAINAVLYIEDLPTIIYAYNKILKEDKLHEFFNKRGTLVVCYELYVKRQFDIAWNGDIDSRLLITKIIAGFISSHSYSTNNTINMAIKQILLEKVTGALFIACIDRIWTLGDLLRHFDSDLIDIELLSSLEMLMREAKLETWQIDNSLSALVNKIRNDKDKTESITRYIKRYENIFERWDKESQKLEENKVDIQNQHLIDALKNISETNMPKYYKYEAAFELSHNIDLLRLQDSYQPFVEIIKQFFDEIDLNKMTLEKTSENYFSLSESLVYIPYYIKAIYHLGIHDLLKSYRNILTKTLPMVCCTSNVNAREIKDIYKKVIGDVHEDEKTELIRWWKSRADDFMNISSEDIFSCITDYGIEALSYKLEEFIEEYLDNQDLSHSIAASKALDIISEGYCNWNIDKYKALFEKLTDNSITSIKMQCNAIMIKKFQDIDAITWRIKYLQDNVVKSVHDKTEHMRMISYEESEIISPNPQMFRCFMSITGNEKLAEQLLGLFDFGLSLSIHKETQEYSNYLLNQIYFFFVNTANIHYIKALRKKVEAFNATNASCLANNIMNNFEMVFLQKEKANIIKAVKQYNKCVEESHLEIRNDNDLRRYFTYIHAEVQKEIQDQGIYSLVSPDTLSEDFIQRELKNTIINKCCQMGLEAVKVDREVALQDNKRTDLLIRYGMCNPIMIELKLLHNKEIQEEKKRQEYKKKFKQYTNAIDACLSVFWIFDVHKKRSRRSEFEKLKIEYNDLKNTLVLLTDCKCSSGIDTGISKKNKTESKIKKTQN